MPKSNKFSVNLSFNNIKNWPKWRDSTVLQPVYVEVDGYQYQIFRIGRVRTKPKEDTISK